MYCKGCRDRPGKRVGTGNVKGAVTYMYHAKGVGTGHIKSVVKGTGTSHVKGAGTVL